MTWWLPGYDYDKPNPIRRPDEQAERRARRIGTQRMVASKMGASFVERMNAKTETVDQSSRPKEAKSVTRQGRT